MDMELISKMIGDLMLDHDSVTLPGVGCLVAEQEPSTFSNKGFTINPPYRRISFISGEGNDHLLSDLYASSNNLSQETASSVIKHFLAQMKEVLADNKTVAFPGLGKMRAVRNGSYIFIQDEDSNICPEYFGLEPLSLRSHNTSYATVPALTEIPAEEASETKEKTAAETSTDITETEVIPEVKKHKSKIWTVLLWMAISLIVIFAALRILGLTAPDFIDRFLYTPEELEILHYQL